MVFLDLPLLERVRTAEESIAVAERLGCPRLNLHGTGLDANGLPVRPVQVDRGTVGLEAWASGDSERALARFRAAFTGSQVPGSRGDRQ